MPSDPELLIEQMLSERIAQADAHFAATAREIAACAAAMADRFWSGATMWVLGVGAQATDARHNAVEYVHPVLPGCRALPAVALTDEARGGAPGSGALLVGLLSALARPGDIAMAISAGAPDDDLAAALAEASRRGLQTIVLMGGGEPSAVAADHVLASAAEDPLIAQELELATYHMLWELTHIALNRRGPAPAPGTEGTVADGTASTSCVTCADELCEVVVERVDADGRSASVTVGGEPTQISIELIDGVREGDPLLVHGGVALQRAAPRSPG